MRKWTMSARAVLAWGIIVSLLAAAALAARPAHASTGTAGITRTTPVSTPATTPATRAGTRAATPAVLTALTTKTAAAASPAAAPAATWTVRPGDTLTAIAAALSIPGGWHTLYTANRHAIGPNPDLIQPGATLMTPRPAASAHAPRPITPGSVPPARPAPPAAPAASPQPVPGHATTPAGNTPAPRATATAPGAGAGAGATVPARVSGLPRWLTDVLLAAGVLAATAFAAEPAAALARRRRTTPPAPHRIPAGTRAPAPAPAGVPASAPCAATRARIVLADHKRLIVTYCTQDDTVYVLTPPGEDPRAVLRAARLVVPENTYEQLAGHLGVPAAWPLE